MLHARYHSLNAATAADTAVSHEVHEHAQAIMDGSKQSLSALRHAL